MRSCRTTGVLVTLGVVLGLAGESRAYIFNKAPRQYQPVTLAELRANPNLWRDTYVKVRVRFKELVDSPDISAWTIFGADEWASFAAWDPEQEIWKDEEYADTHDYFFVKKAPEKMSHRSLELDCVRLARQYDELLVWGFVQNNIGPDKGRSWVVVEKIEPFNRPWCIEKFLGWLGCIETPRPFLAEYVEAMRSGNRFEASRPDLAVTEYRRAYQKSPTKSKYHQAEAARALGLALAKTGSENAGDAALYLEQAAKAFPKDTGVNEALAVALLRSARPKKALGVLDRSIARQPRHAGYRILLADALKGMGREKEAMNAILIAVEQEDQKDEKKEKRNAAPYLALGRIYREEGRFEEAEKILDKALDAAAISPAPYREKAALYIEMGNLAKAKEMLINAKDFSGGDKQELAQVSFLKGLVAKKENNAAEAKQAFMDAVEKAPQLSEAHYELGLMLFKENMLEDALRHFEDARSAAGGKLLHLATLEAARALVTKEGNGGAKDRAAQYLSGLIADKAVDKAIRAEAEGMLQTIKPPPVVETSPAPSAEAPPAQ